MSLPPFERVIQQHAGVVLSVCHAQAGPQLADDVFQETMLATLRAYPELRDPQAVRGWLCSIAVRKSIDAHRAAAKRPTPVDHEVADDRATADRESDPVGDAEVWAQVRALPDKQRTAVTLRYLADLTNDEIATVMSISTDAARRNVFEGLERLRSHGDGLPGVFST